MASFNHRHGATSILNGIIIDNLDTLHSIKSCVLIKRKNGIRNACSTAVLSVSSVSICFLSGSICFYLVLSVSICFYLFLSVFVGFCLFLSVFVCFINDVIHFGGYRDPPPRPVITSFMNSFYPFYLLHLFLSSFICFYLFLSVLSVFSHRGTGKDTPLDRQPQPHLREPATNI